ncbi:MAG: transposon Tn7-like transposase protein [Pseudomonas sp.]|nr:transposon Tn7-like transposase protein [Pseudomonas sp.]
MYEIHDVYVAATPSHVFDCPVRVLETIDLKKVILIKIKKHKTSKPFSVDYSEWIELLNSESLVKVSDPLGDLPSIPPKLPHAAEKRFKQLSDITSTLSAMPDFFTNKKAVNAKIKQIAASLDLTEKTVKVWVSDWLQAGRNTVAVVSKFVDKDHKAVNPPTSGTKRGAKPHLLSADTGVPSYEVEPQITKAYTSYITQQRMTWKDAFHEMLLSIYNLPPESISEGTDGLLLNPALAKKYRVPTWRQFRYRCRKLKKANTELETESPRGSRGKANDYVPGPGFYEIDATHFQIQLVSRITKSLLVGRPTVYLIVETYDGAIAGYAVSLENPSWAIAALALHNCFTDKSSVFERLGLPYSSSDWPCHHLPTLLRADRAELISNMGHNFVQSGIRVEVTPSMTPIAKGTVEGKNAELKNSRSSRFDLPGRFSKKRERRSPDGKKTAALDIFEFERILVEIIMDLNNTAIDPKKIPPDALAEGPKVASRIGLHRWALRNRAGFTRNMGPNFAYEYLMTNSSGRISPLGILFQGETYNCDHLRSSGLLSASINQSIKVKIAYNPLLASEIYFYDPDIKSWLPAFNTDPEIYDIRASFPEVKDFRATQKQLGSQAELNHYSKRRVSVRAVKAAVQKSVVEKRNSPMAGRAVDIRQNRSQERANERSSGLNGALSQTLMAELAPLPNRPTATTDAEDNKNEISIWDEVDAINIIK